MKVRTSCWAESHIRKRVPWLVSNQVLLLQIFFSLSSILIIHGNVTAASSKHTSAHCSSVKDLCVFPYKSYPFVSSLWSATFSLNTPTGNAGDGSRARLLLFRAMRFTSVLEYGPQALISVVRSFVWLGRPVVNSILTTVEGGDLQMFK